jgi:hypothetical protein
MGLFPLILAMKFLCREFLENLFNIFNVFNKIQKCIKKILSFKNLNFFFKFGNWRKIFSPTKVAKKPEQNAS